MGEDRPYPLTDPMETFYWFCLDDWQFRRLFTEPDYMTGTGLITQATTEFYQAALGVDATLTLPGMEGQ